MQISIDTRHDSPEDIKKVIKMLQHLVGENAYTNQPNIFEAPTQPTEATAGFASMFGDTSPKPAEEPKKKSSSQIIAY
ncbi:MAG: hypothetical protein KKC75_04320 [Nanoarchaeota archaeon]|nr:hypothetical protein [Nanoarchaeota archaeon]MBU1004590.1 hypothetical protein [Nanoarchaeota archaeon]MBU1946984.1 hypothetical protein [Nanoarchaeota archaeon]